MSVAVRIRRAGRGVNATEEAIEEATEEVDEKRSLAPRPEADEFAQAGQEEERHAEGRGPERLQRQFGVVAPDGWMQAYPHEYARASRSS
jgi:hypothetical protein